MAFGDSIRVENGYQKNTFTHYPVLIIGAGESGLAMGFRMKDKLGFDQLRIFDRQSGIGGEPHWQTFAILERLRQGSGTWWINRYPGVVSLFI